MHLNRRSALALPGLLVATACTHKVGPGPAPKADPDVALRAAAITRESALIARYTAVIAAVPALSARLGALRDDHRAHLVALGAAASSPVPSDASTGPDVAALKELRTLETTASAEHAAAALSASPALAATLASLAASEASHVVVL